MKKFGKYSILCSTYNCTIKLGITKFRKIVIIYDSLFSITEKNEVTLYKSGLYVFTIRCK